MDTLNENSISTQGVGVETITSMFTTFTGQVQNSYPSIFTKEDVTHLLTQLEAKLLSQVAGLPSDNSELKEKVKAVVESVIDSHDYDENAEFELSGRSIILDFSSYELNREVMKAIDDAFNEA